MKKRVIIHIFCLILLIAVISIMINSLHYFNNSNTNLDNSKSKFEENSEIAKNCRGMTLSGNNLLVIDSNSSLKALNTKTSKEKWVFKPDNGDFAYLVISDNDHLVYLIYEFDKINYLYIVDANTGKNILKRTILHSSVISAEPIIYKDLIIMITRVGWVSAFDRKTIKIVWEKETGVESLNYLKIEKENLYAIGGYRLLKLVEMDVETGMIKRTWKNESPFLYGGLEINDEKMYFLEIKEDESEEYKEYFTSVDLDTFSILWRIQLGNYWGDENIAFIKYSERIYFNSGPYFYSFNAKTGELIWKRELVASSFYPSKGIIYLYNNAGYVFALDKTTGIELWKKRIETEYHDLNYISLIYCDKCKTLFIRTAKNMLIAFNTVRRGEIWKLNI